MNKELALKLLKIASNILTGDATKDDAVTCLAAAGYLMQDACSVTTGTDTPEGIVQSPQALEVDGLNVIKIDGVTYKAIECTSCTGCAFSDKPQCNVVNQTPGCTRHRSDNRSIIWLKVG